MEKSRNIFLITLNKNLLDLEIWSPSQRTLKKVILYLGRSWSLSWGILKMGYLMKCVTLVPCVVILPGFGNTLISSNRKSLSLSKLLLLFYQALPFWEKFEPLHFWENKQNFNTHPHWHFFLRDYDFNISQEKDACLDLMKNIKYTEFFKTLNQNLVEYSKFTNFYEKACTKRMALAQ